MIVYCDIVTLLRTEPVMIFDIQPDSPVPIYEQIVAQVTFGIAAGALAGGALIPSVRELAGQLLVHPNTVARAYLELERAGLVTKRHGSGTYVSDTGSPLARRERLRILSQRADTLLAEAEHLDISLDQVLDLLRERHEAMQRYPHPQPQTQTQFRR